MWFNKASQDILQKFNVDLNTGLSELEAKKRLEEHGENKLNSQKKKAFFNFSYLK